MARHLISVSGLGSPTAAAFISNMNNALSGLLNKVLVSVQIVMTDALPAYTRQIQAIVEYEDGGVTMGAPFTVTVIESASSEALKAQGEAFFAANASSFISPVQFRYSDQLPNVATRYLSFYFANTDVANGTRNYQVNGTVGAGSGTVTSVSVVSANGVSGSVATATTTPAITLTLGAITPTSVAASGTVTGSNLSGTNTGDQTITLTGDVTGSGTGSFATTIAANAVTYAKMQQVGAARLLGNGSGATANVAEVSLGSTLAFSTNVLLTQAMTGDVTTPINSFSTTIAANAVTLAKFQQISTGSLLGRSTAATGNVEVITVGSGLTLSGGTLSATAGGTGTVTNVSVVSANGVSGTVSNSTTTPAITLTLGSIAPTQINAGGLIQTSGNISAGGTITGSNLSGTNTGNQTITLTGDISGSGTGSFNTTLVPGTVTLAKMATLSANSIIGNNSGSSATPQALSVTSVTAMLNTVTSTVKGLVPAYPNNSSFYFAGDGTWTAFPATNLTNAVILFPTFSTRNRIQPQGDAIVGLSVQGFSASHTAHMQDWQTSNGTVRSYVSAAGRHSASLNGVTANEYFGEGAGSSLTTGGSSTGIGYFALGVATSGVENTAVGAQTLFANTTGNYNTAVGANALRASVSVDECTAVGTSAFRLGTGARNTAVGAGALNGSVTGTNNAVFGWNAGQQMTSGILNTLLGAEAGTNAISNSNCTIIGNQSQPSSNSVSNEVTLGNSSITSLRCAVTTITAISDARDKANVIDLDAGLDFISNLRPVRFDWAMRDGGKVGIQDIGFIAQDLLTAQEASGVSIPHLVNSNNPDRFEAGYGMLLAPMVKAIQELRTKVAKLEGKA